MRRAVGHYGPRSISHDSRASESSARLNAAGVSPHHFGVPGDDLTAPSSVFTSANGSRWTEVETENPPTIDAVWEYFGTAHFVGRDETWLLVPAEGGDRTNGLRPTTAEAGTNSSFPSAQRSYTPI